MPSEPGSPEAGPRPDHLVLVLGTGTGVGKTWVAARLIGALRRRGVAAAARKPAQSFGAIDDPAGRDADVLGRASGELPEAVCPRHRWYPVEMAPPMAAASLASPEFSVEDLLAELRWPVPDRPASGLPATGVRSVGVVELAGGVRSPQAADGDGVDLWRRLRPDTTVVVGDAGLGTINAVRLTVEALSGEDRRTLAGAVVVLNRFDPGSELHRRNHQWLTGNRGVVPVPVLVTPGDEERLVDRVLAQRGGSPAAGHPPAPASHALGNSPTSSSG